MQLDPKQPLSAAELEQQRLEAAGDNDSDESDDGDDDGNDDSDSNNERTTANPPQRKLTGSAAARPGASAAEPQLAAQKEPEKAKPSLLAGPQLGSDGQPLSVDGLKQRLAEKLQQLRSGRGGVPKAQKPAEPKKEKQPKHVAGGQNKHRPHGDASAHPGKGGGGGGEVEGSGSGGAGGNGRLEYNKLQTPGDKPSKQKRISTAAALAQAEEAERRKRARLSAPDGGGEDVQIEEWQRALQKAGGIKQKDNPTLLRKVRATARSPHAWQLEAPRPVVSRSSGPYPPCPFPRCAGTQAAGAQEEEEFQGMGEPCQDGGQVDDGQAGSPEDQSQGARHKGEE